MLYCPQRRRCSGGNSGFPARQRRIFRIQPPEEKNEENSINNYDSNSFFDYSIDYHNFDKLRKKAKDETGQAMVEFAFVQPKRDLPKPFDRAITQVGRIDDMIKEHQQPASEFKLTDDNYQRSIAKVAVMRGGITPFGVGPGRSRERDFLPLAYADYIYAIIVEETGIIGGALLIVLYLMILIRACFSSSKYDDYQAMLMTMGLALMITCQALISMAVAVGLGPVTGQPLPMVSKGGTSVLITSLYFGVMMAVAREQNELKAGVTRSVLESQNDIPELTEE